MAGLAGGQTLRHGPRGHPLCACRRGEVPRRARRPVPRLGLGRPRRVRCGGASAHTALAGLIALATMEVVSLLSGTGWGWIRTTTTADASFTGVTPVNLVARCVSIGQPRRRRSRSPPGRCDRCSACWAPPRRLRRVPPAAPLPADGIVRCLGLTLLVAGPARPHRVVLVRDLGRDRARAGRRGPAASGLIVISTFWAFVGVTTVKASTCACCTRSC